MAYLVSDQTREILDGEVLDIPTASAFYNGAVTVPGLPVTGLTWTSELSEQVVRHSAVITISDDEGRLAPIRSSDPLAPYGAQLALSETISAPGHATLADMIPVGRMLIMTAAPTGGWRLHFGKIEPTGGAVVLELQDLAQDLVDTETPSPIRPAENSTAAQLINQICHDVVAVTTSGLPQDMPAVSASLSVPTNRMDALKTIITGTKANMRVTRGGVLEFFTLPTTVSKSVTLTDRTWLNTVVKLDRAGIINTVVASSDSADSNAIGLTYETEGPFAVWGPLGTRVERITSPNYSSKTAAAIAAINRLAQIQAERALTVEASIRFDPTIDAGDLHKVTLVPGQLEPEGRVTRVSWTSGNPVMSVTYAIDRNEVDAWVRPTDWLPA